MKKSQILAALALAFALGVVAPVASTSAYVGGNAAGNMTTEQGNTITRDLNNAIADAKSVDNYSDYSWLSTANDMYDEAFAPVERAQASALKTAISNANNSYATGISTSGDVTAIYNAVNTGIKRLQNELGILEQKENKTDADTTKINNIEQAIAALNAAKVAADTAFNNVVTTSVKIDADTIVSNIEKISETVADNLTDSQAYKDASGDAEKVGLALAAARALPKFGVIAPLVEAVEEAEKVVKAQADGGAYYSYEQASDALKALNAALAKFNGTTDGTGDGTNKPEEGGNKAPNTGILADAEGNASTTVAMVAGIATALTAAGAGVVAYRNARRSTRK